MNKTIQPQTVSLTTATIMFDCGWRKETYFSYCSDSPMLYMGNYFIHKTENEDDGVFWKYYAPQASEILQDLQPFLRGSHGAADPLHIEVLSFGIHPNGKYYAFYAYPGDKRWQDANLSDTLEGALAALWIQLHNPDYEKRS